MDGNRQKRRSRNVPAPTGREVRLTDHDISGILKPLSRYAQLPTDYIELFDQRANTDKRLTDFFQEFKGRDRYIERFPLKGLGRKWYRLAERGKAALHAAGHCDDDSRRWISATRIGRRAFDEHQKMLSLAMANIEIFARASGIRFISHIEILRRASAAAKASDRPLAIPISLPWAAQQRTVIEPDALFGLMYKNSNTSFFAVEVDNDSEPFEATDRTRSSIERKIRSYLAAMQKGDGIPAYKSHFGVTSFNVLFAARSPRVAEMLKRARGYGGHERFYFRGLPYETVFDDHFSPSRELFHGEWQTPKGPAYIDRP